MEDGGCQGGIGAALGEHVGDMLYASRTAGGDNRYGKFLRQGGVGITRIAVAGLMTSTQVDEEAQHFYRKLGYKDCGGFTVDVPGYEQPMEMIMIKAV